MHLARAKGLEFRRLVLDGQVPNAIDDHVFGIVEVGIPDQVHMRTNRPFLEHIGSVGHQVAGAGETAAVRLQAGPVHRIHRGMCQQVEEVGRRVGERNLKCEAVKARHAQVIRRQFAREHRAGVGDGIEHIGVIGGGSRVGAAPQTEDKIFGGQGVSVRPGPVATQVERVG